MLLRPYFFTAAVVVVMLADLVPNDSFLLVFKSENNFYAAEFARSAFRTCNFDLFESNFDMGLGA